MVKFINRAVDFFYIKPFRFIPLNTFRYAAVGGANIAFNIVLYWFCFNFILHQRDVDFGIVVVSAPILSFLIAFLVTFCTGFWLTRNVAFSGSELRGREQLFRYAQVVAVNVLINYFGLKLLVNVMDFYPSLSYAGIQVVTVLFSYIMQRFYTFKGHTKL